MDLPGDAHDEAHVVLDEEHRQVEIVAKPEEEVAEVLNLLVREPTGRLVEQQQAGPRRKGPGELDSLQRSVRQPGGRMGREVGDADELERINGSSSRFSLTEPRGAGCTADEHVLEHGHAREEGDVLERPSDAAPHDRMSGQPKEILTVVQDTTRVRLVQSGDDVERRRLACAVWSDQAEDLTLGHLEGDVVEGNDAPESAGDVLDGQRRHEAGILRRPRQFSPAVVALDGGITRITFPLPLGIDHVHAYLVPTDDGGTILVDTGLGLPGAEESWAAVFGQTGMPDRIVVTHFHPDHVGGAAIVAGLSGAPVHQGELDYEHCRRAWTGEAAVAASEHLLEHGMPEDEADSVRRHQQQLTAFIHYAPDPIVLSPGDSIGGWEVLHLPGHADGHLALIREGLLVAGDALLGGITPNVGLWPRSAPDPLSDYLRSLAKIGELDPWLALPGHGERIIDPAGRAQEIAEHHHDRLERTLAVLSEEPCSGYDLAHVLFPDALAAPLRRFALAETLAHVEHLVLAGRARRVTEGSRTFYTS
jgi:glyoxylase-like metal-dependent hydrolase (beta-lactamase superfamily II)